MNVIRKRVNRLDQDRYLADDMAAVKDMVMNLEVISVLEHDNLLPSLKI